MTFNLCSGRQNVYYKYQYSKTYTLHSGLNRLQLYVTEIKETQIFKRIKVATPHFWERFLQIADPCLFLWKLPRCEPKCPQQRSNIQPQALRICKKRTQKVLMFATWFFQVFVFLLFLSHTPEVYSNHNTVCMFYCIGIYNKHCLPLQNWKTITFNIHTHSSFPIL